jgi:hypothetical protein
MTRAKPQPGANEASVFRREHDGEGPDGLGRVAQVFAAGG